MSGPTKEISRDRKRAGKERLLVEALLHRRSISRRSLIAGVVGTILFHLLGFFWMPSDVFTTERAEIQDRFKEYEVELVPPEEEEPDQVYTQTNPDAPVNEPDQTNNFAARSQQAAQEEKPDEIDPENRPSVESEDDIETNQFLTGDLSPPEISPPPAPESQEQEETEEAEERPLITPQIQAPPLIKQIPIPGEQEEEDPDETGLAEIDHDETDPPTNVNEYLKGEAEEGEEEEVEATALRPLVLPQNAQVSSDYSEPSPRPRLRLPKVAPGPRANREPGVSQTGTIAVDAKFSEFGEYMERLIETISVRWNSLAEEGAAKESRSKVRLRFVLTKDGYIKDLNTLPDTTAKVIGIYMCRTAIENGAPFGPWTPEMVAVFGDEEVVTFSFHYR